MNSPIQAHSSVSTRILAVRSSIHSFLIVLGVCLTQQFFEGGKADLAKGLSANFQVTHAFTLTNSMVMPPTYHFGAIYVAGKVLM